MRQKPRYAAFDPLQFEWDVSAQGYEWTRETALGEKGSGDYLVARPAAEPPRVYRPLSEETGLFKRFAETAATKEGIAAFANRYGPLGVSQFLVPPKGKGTHSKVEQAGEPFSVWKAEIAAMREVVELLDVVRAGDAVELSKRLTVANRKPGRGIYAGREAVALEYAWPDVVQRFEKGERTEAALWHLQTLVNRRLLERPPRARLLWTPGDWDRKVSGERQRRLGLFYVPANLIGALWVQVASAVAGDAEYRQCAACSRWFEVSPSVSRSDRQYCSGACRGRAFRARAEKSAKRKKATRRGGRRKRRE